MVKFFRLTALPNPCYVLVIVSVSSALCSQTSANVILSLVCVMDYQVSHRECVDHDFGCLVFCSFFIRV